MCQCERLCGCAGFVRSESAQIANPCSAVGTSSGRHVVRGAFRPYSPLHASPPTAAGVTRRREEAHETARDREISVPEEEVLDILMTDRVNGARARAGSGSQMGPNGAGPAPKNLDWSCAWWSVANEEFGMLTGCRTELTRGFRFDEPGGWGFRPGQ